MKKILGYTRKYLGYILLSPICIMGEVILEIELPKVMATIVDVSIPSKVVSEVAKNGLIMVGMSLLALGLGFLSNLFASIGGVGFGSELRKAVFTNIQDFSFEDIDNFQTSSLLTRLTTDVDNIQQGLMMAIRIFVRAPFMLIMAVISAYRINAEIMKIFLYATPVILVAVIIFGAAIIPRIKAIMEAYDGLNARVREDLTNIRVVKSFVRSDYERKRFSDSNNRLYNASISGEGLMTILMPVAMLVVYACMITIWYVGGQKVIVGQMKTGNLLSFISYAMTILSSIAMVAMIFLSVMRLKTSVNRISEVLNTKSSLVGKDLYYDLEDSSIQFKNVCFKYDKNGSENVLKDINISIASGQTIGILGPTGCGKSTFINMISRLYDVDSGSVIVGGHDVKDYNLKALRDNVAVVLQQNVLFSGTIIDNIRWGNKEASLDEVKRVCQLSNASEFIESFEKGYDTDLSQGGVNLSGGQKQRLCIARALLKKPKIIILDDSTSAVDTATDASIRQALKTELKGTTTLIIAQRVSSILDADKVIVMNNGKIEAFDTVKNLLKGNDMFKEIYQTQMKGVE